MRFGDMCLLQQSQGKDYSNGVLTYGLATDVDSIMARIEQSKVSCPQEGQES